MSLYEMIMGGVQSIFTRANWSDLGRGQIADEDTVKKMLMEGYGAVADED